MRKCLEMSKEKEIHITMTNTPIKTKCDTCCVFLLLTGS